MSLKKTKTTDTKSITNPVLKDVFTSYYSGALTLEDIWDIIRNEDEISYINLSGVEKELELKCTELPHCCGIYELGELPNIGHISQKAFDFLMKGILLSKFTFIINTNGKDASINWETKLGKCKMFTPVKQFKNPNGGNIVTMWVSNEIIK